MARILLVEDNPLNRELTADLLEMSGYEVDSAATGKEALRMASSNRPDLILLDLSLPDMDGLAVVRELKADPLLRELPVLAVTAHALKSDQQKAMQVGCVAYISKPVDTRHLLNQVETFLTASPGGQKEESFGSPDE